MRPEAGVLNGDPDQTAEAAYAVVFWVSPLIILIVTREIDESPPFIRYNCNSYGDAGDIYGSTPYNISFDGETYRVSNSRVGDDMLTAATESPCELQQPRMRVLIDDTYIILRNPHELDGIDIRLVLCPGEGFAINREDIILL